MATNPQRSAVDYARDELIARDIVKEATEKGAPLEWDYWIYRIVVTTLGLAVLGALAGAIYLAAVTKEIPQVLVALGSAAVGALAGLIAPAPAAGGR